MQDINKSKVELREIGKRKHERFISRFEPLDPHPRLHHNERFSLFSQNKPSKDTIFNPSHMRRTLSQLSSTQEECKKQILIYTRGEYKANEDYNTCVGPEASHLSFDDD